MKALQEMTDHQMTMLWALVGEKAESLHWYAQKCEESKDFEKWTKEADFWKEIADKLKPYAKL